MSNNLNSFMNAIQQDGMIPPEHIELGTDEFKARMAAKHPAPSKLEVTGVTEVTTNKDRGCSWYPTDETRVTKVTIPENERPCWKVFDEWTYSDAVRMRPGAGFLVSKPGRTARMHFFNIGYVHLFTLKLLLLTEKRIILGGS